ncbi:hypothetical protein CAI21_07775 [Alkalilimnicola ehrlichii]|uniref:Uncharacterized protein n=1 Tax=Alkalilimnicola ehrlichii TaxID=351052 RepID=A0A3E0WZI9_9GAMM|nr:hypothetical protein [Alkalilimnicola ehrlichii]RFA30091.1 hypothetical protein CAI21_07775 [Alkalilimnicola ehrlichii]RFA37436.1 hypothetical protein CAL65_09115 [Alkalilimnicola ehrlichii]
MTERPIPKAWAGSKRQIRANQLAFNLSSDAIEFFRRVSAQRGMATSDFLRDLVGLPVKPPQRPRLTFSASPEDMEKLAARYGLAEVDPSSIRERIQDELLRFYQRHRDDSSER